MSYIKLQKTKISRFKAWQHSKIRIKLIILRVAKRGHEFPVKTNQHNKKCQIRAKLIILYQIYFINQVAVLNKDVILFCNNLTELHLRQVYNILIHQNQSNLTRTHNIVKIRMRLYSNLMIDNQVTRCIRMQIRNLTILRDRARILNFINNNSRRNKLRLRK